MKLILIVIVIWLLLCTNSKWLEFDDVGYKNYQQLDLSGGTNNDQYTYTSPNAIAVVRSSAPRYQNSDHYYLSNLFDGSLYYRTHGNNHGHSYWLGSCSGNTERISITFDTPQNISHVVVSARMLSTDRYSWYAIDAYKDAADFNNGDLIQAFHITQMVNTDNDYFGKVHAHSVKGQFEVLVFYITKPTSYCALNEIEIFVAQ
eukprot:487656_1